MLSYEKFRKILDKSEKGYSEEQKKEIYKFLSNITELNYKIINNQKNK